jgi:formylglycine-generating enzyme required for sulfatase activity
MINYYDVLELEIDATQDQIKAQYRFLVQAWHPDKFASPESKARAEERLKKINEAYAVLRDATKREQFDHQRQSEKMAQDFQFRTELEKRTQEARAVAEQREQEARIDLEHKARAEKMAEDLLRKLADQKALRESELRRMRALNLQLATGVVMEFVRVPAGKFLMGSDTFKDPDARKDEKPQHTIYLSEYLIGQVPVTNRQYRVFLQDSQHHPPLYWQNGAIPLGKENHPVVNVNWQDAVAFCGWLSRLIGMKVRLPSEAEWEKAARGVDGRLFPWGNQPPGTDLAIFNQNDTNPVGEYLKGMSPYGAMDMSGNVLEWVNDFYSKNYYQVSPTANPPGPVWGEYRVLKGGSFDSHADLIRPAGRFWGMPLDSALNSHGFRCALSI